MPEMTQSQMTKPGPPRSEEELLERARNIAGHTLEQLAAQLGVRTPESNVRGKGWAGQLVELALGATAGAASIPDFPHLGIELKTIPVSATAVPRESTFVCTTPLLPCDEMQFHSSCVARKLARVLWLPLESLPRQAVPSRRIGRAGLWSPSAVQLQTLKADFEDHMEMIQMGQVAHITARHGQVLQIRPKAASAAERAEAVGPDGTNIWTNPRGFYLRTQFTRDVLMGDMP
jgi:DNA mismatch repair protein MutH